jgi:hypothetical protein
MKKTRAAVREFREPKDADEYRACLAEGVGYIANCCSGWPLGYMPHHASCSLLHRYQHNNPIKGNTGKLWAATTEELEAYAGWDQRLGRCGCFRPEMPDQYDTDIPRESHLVVPGGQVESNRGRH